MLPRCAAAGAGSTFRPLHYHAAGEENTLGELDTNDWLLWQWIDSAFPTGAFAHSGGLEALWQAGEVTGVDALGEYVRAALLQSACGPLTFVVAAHRGDASFAAIDARCDAFISNAVANRASRRQGQAMLRSTESTFTLAALGDVSRDVRAGVTPGHVAPIFGVAASALGLTLERTRSAFLFATLRTGLSSAVRLGILGPLQAQQLQHEIAKETPTLLAMVPDLPYTRAVQTSPMLDVFQAMQDRLYSKLFQS